MRDQIERQAERMLRAMADSVTVTAGDLALLAALYLYVWASSMQ